MSKRREQISKELVTQIVGLKSSVPGANKFLSHRADCREKAAEKELRSQHPAMLKNSGLIVIDETYEAVPSNKEIVEFLKMHSPEYCGKPVHD